MVGQRPSRIARLTALVCALVPVQAAAQGTTRLQRLLQVEISALVCEVELPDEVEDGLDREIHAEQRRLGLSERQMAAVYERVRLSVMANPEAACESVRQLDPSPGEPDDE